MNSYYNDHCEMGYSSNKRQRFNWFLKKLEILDLI
jgi:hypothetical protein